MTRLGCVLLVASALSISACSGGGGGGAGGGPGSNPKTKEEALQKITPEQRAHFESWTQSVVKACDSTEAFGLGSVGGFTSSGLDGAALIKKNNNSIIFTEGKNFAVLTDYETFSGISESKAEQTIEINGQKSTISVETKRSGSSCEVYLFGQKVYETQIFSTFTVGTNFIQDRVATSASKISNSARVGQKGLYEISQPGLYSLVHQSLLPNKEGLTLIGKVLGLSEAQISKYLKYSLTPSYRAAVRIYNEPTTVWSQAQYGNFIASNETLNKYFGNSATAITLEVRLQIPHYNFYGQKNEMDNGSLTFLIKSSIEKKDADLNYALVEIKNNGVTPFNTEEAVTCSMNRLDTYLGTSTKAALSPSVNLMLQPCRVLHSDIEEALFKNGYAAMIAKIFENVQASAQIEYGGWDYVLTKLSKELISQKKNIVAELDPESKTQIVPNISFTLESLQQEIEKAKNLAPLKESILQMGISWVFKNSLVSNTEISRILQSLDNSADVFVVSTDRLVSSLGGNPFKYQEQLTFASNLTSSYKSEALRALNLSKDLSYSGFEQDVFNQILQLQTPVSELSDWSTRFTAIKGEINKFTALTAAKGELVKHSIKWLKTGERTVENLSEVYAAINNAIDPFKESTLKLVNDLDQSLPSNLDSLTYANNITPEFKKLALAIVANSTVSAYESWGKNFFATVLQAKPSIELVRQYNDLWSSVVAFETREKSRLAGEIGSMPKWNREKVIAKAVQEIWSGEDFATLEVIATVAQEKNTCTRFKDASSLAECAGLQNFSKNEKKFLSPEFQGRYKQLGSDLNSFMKRIPGSEWTTFKWSLLDAFFGTWEPLWSRCDNNVFAVKLNELRALLNSLATEKDQFKKWDLERKIKDSFDNCR